MIKPKIKTASYSNITKHTNRSSDVKLINAELTKKLKLVKSELKLRKTHVKSIVEIQKGQKAEFLQMRKQNHLNSQYNKRMTNLITITKENKKIYQRLNSQKSNYSSRAMNKSYQSIHSSRLTNRSSRSRSSIKRNETKVLKLQLRGKKSQVVVKAENINNLRDQDLSEFGRMFFRNVPLVESRPEYCRQKDNMELIREKIQEVDKENHFQKRLKKSKSGKLGANNLTPEKIKNLKYKGQSIGLPSVKKTPQREQTALQKIIDNLGFKYKY